MEYNYERIGERIKEEREKLKISQEKLTEMLFIGRNTMSKIENGKAEHIDLNVMVDLCKIFDCELGYLLCEYDCKTRAATDIQAETGLSERAILALQEANGSSMYFVLLALDELLKHDSLYTLDKLGQYLTISDACMTERIDGQPIKQKTLFAVEVQQCFDDMRRKVQEGLSGFFK